MPRIVLTKPPVVDSSISQLLPLFLLVLLALTAAVDNAIGAIDAGRTRAEMMETSVGCNGQVRYYENRGESLMLDDMSYPYVDCDFTTSLCAHGSSVS